jgi:hypothetical protein
MQPGHGGIMNEKRRGDNYKGGIQRNLVCCRVLAVWPLKAILIWRQTIHARHRPLQMKDQSRAFTNLSMNNDVAPSAVNITLISLNESIFVMRSPGLLMTHLHPMIRLMCISLWSILSLFQRKSRSSRARCAATSLAGSTTA